MARRAVQGSQNGRQKDQYLCQRLARPVQAEEQGRPRCDVNYFRLLQGGGNG